MHRICSIAVLLQITRASAGNPAPIVGGVPAIGGQFPTVAEIVSISGTDRATCTGTLIAPSWVLTAAHCIQPGDGTTTVQFGVVDDSDPSAIVIQVAALVPDPLYVQTQVGSHDLGLIMLATPVTNVVPIAINFDAGLAPVGVAVTTIGFGEDHLGLEYELENSSTSCAPAGFDDTNLLCFSQTADEGIGDGDSGGPSFATVRGHWLQVGVTSFTHDVLPVVGALTRVDIESEFILQHIPELDCTQSASACPANLACVGGTCVGAPCTHDADCSDAGTCFDGGCIAAPFSSMGIGASCTGGADCDSDVCYTAAEGARCTFPCTFGDSSSCPASFTCEHASDLGVADLGDPTIGVCWPSSSGCCDASGRGAPTMWLAIVIVFAIQHGRRRLR